MCVFVSVRARKCTHTCMCGEGGATPPREGVSTHKRGREGERWLQGFIFPSLISNLLKIETTANSFSLILFFSAGKNCPGQKYPQLQWICTKHMSGIFFKKTLCISFHGPVAWYVNTETRYHRPLISLGLLMWIKRRANGPKGT